MDTSVADTNIDQYLNAEPEGDAYLQTQLILLAASQHNIEDLRSFLKTTSPTVQDPETGATALHAAIASLESDPDAQEDTLDPEELELAKQTVRLLLENGAIWNDLDFNDETPGCVALRLGLGGLYELIVEAGVRAELLLGRLDGYFLLGEGEDGEVDEEDALQEDAFEEADSNGADVNGSAEVKAGEHQEREAQPLEVTVNNDEAKIEENIGADLENPDVASASYLTSSLRFEDGKLLDADKNGVMMSWEADIMRRTANALCPQPNLRILNIGHGLGIIDNLFQEHSPKTHHIVEAHLAVLEKMGKDGWPSKPGVTIFPRRWQDVLPSLRAENQEYDAIFYDTFAESYDDLKKDFFREAENLLAEGGRFSFFCGQGADRQVCYDVYQRVLEVDLAQAGFEVEWEDVPVPDLDETKEWEGVRRKYWACKNYRLPICWRDGERNVAETMELPSGLPVVSTELNPSEIAREA